MRVNWKIVTTFLLTGVFVGVRIAMRAVECLDGDEMFSLEVAKQSWTQLWAMSAPPYDSHPPLFHALLKIWINLGGESLPWLRLMPTLAAIASLLPLWGLCSALKLRHEEMNLTLAVLTLNGFVLYYSIQLRPYSLLLFASLCSLWAFAHWLNLQCRSWQALSVLLAANMFLIYTGYWGLIVVGCQGAYLVAFAPRSVLKFVMIGCFLASTYIPWALTLLRVATSAGTLTSQVSWITKPGLSDLAWFYYRLLGELPVRHSTSLGLALSGTPIILWAWAAIKYRDRCEVFSVLIWFAILPTILTFVASLVLKQSAWAERCLIICVAPYAMLLSVAACRLPGKSGVVIPLALFLWAISSGVHYLSEPHKLSWESLASQLARAESGANAPVPIYTVEGYIAKPLRFFSAEQGTTNTLSIRQTDPKNLGKIEDQHCWIIYREFGDKVWLMDRRPEDILKGRHQIGRVVHTGGGGMSVRAVPLFKK